MASIAPKTCFVITPIGEPGSATRQRADKVLAFIIRPAIEPLGYTVTLRADQLDEPGIVSSQIVGQLIDSDLVVADLSDLNANVFYEVAVRHVVERPIVHLINEEDASRIPFDVNQVRAIRYGLDVALAYEAQERIASQVRAWESGHWPVENPISRGVDVNLMIKSGDPIERALGELRTSFDELASGVRRALEDETPAPSQASFLFRKKRLESQFHAQAELVLRMQRAGIEAFLADDFDLAKQVVDFDDEVDLGFIRIESGVQSLVAAAGANSRSQGELLALMVVNELVERLADSWVTIAKLTQLTNRDARDEELLAVITELLERAENMVRIALEAFETRDIDGAESLVDQDEYLDRSARRFLERFVQLPDESPMREWAWRMSVLARTAERVGDRAVDIGEKTAFLLTAEFRRLLDGRPPTEPTDGEAAE